MIAFQHVSIRQKSTIGERLVVEDVSFQIEEGEIFGIAGPAGSGKSALLRTVNALERPALGDVVVDGQAVSALSAQGLKDMRGKVGLVLPGSSLMESKPLWENIALSVWSSPKKPEESIGRVRELLALTGLEGLENARPASLSPEQRQRGAIARALFGNPKILLCQEVTDRLPPASASAVLTLLKAIHQALQITMVVSTSELDVLKQLCSRAAIMQESKLVELNDLYSLFSAPAHPFTKEFVAQQTAFSLPEEVKEHAYGTIVSIEYIGESANEPVLYETSQRFGVEYNILQGRIEYIGGKALGKMYVSFNSEPALMSSVLAYLKEATYRVEVIQHV